MERSIAWAKPSSRFLSATAAFVRSVSNFWSVTSVPFTSEKVDEIFHDGDRDGRVMMVPWPWRC
jgi:hypothetical protein